MLRGSPTTVTLNGKRVGFRRFNKSVGELVKPMYDLHQVYSRWLDRPMQSLIAGITLFMGQGADLSGKHGDGQ